MQFSALTQSFRGLVAKVSTLAHATINADAIRAAKAAKDAAAALEQRRQLVYDRWLEEMKWLGRCADLARVNPESASQESMAAGYLTRSAFLDAPVRKPVAIHEQNREQVEAELSMHSPIFGGPGSHFTTYEQLHELALDAEAKFDLLGATEESRVGIEYLYESGEHDLKAIPGCITTFVSIRRGAHCWYLTGISEGFNRSPACTVYALRMRWKMEERERVVKRVRDVAVAKQAAINQAKSAAANDEKVAA